MNNLTTPVRPIALHAGEGEALWAFGTLATIKASSETTDGRVAVIEHLAPEGAGSPLHVHHREDEWFYVTEGDADLLGRRRADRGPSRVVRVRAARHPPHLRRHLRHKRDSCSSPSPPASRASCARWASRRTLTIPPPAAPPPDLAPLIAAAAEYGIEILGPPGIPT